MTPAERYQAHKLVEATWSAGPLLHLLERHVDRETWRELTEDLRCGLAAFADKMAAAETAMAFLRENPENAGLVFDVEMADIRETLAWAAKLSASESSKAA